MYVRLIKESAVAALLTAAMVFLGITNLSAADLESIHSFDIKPQKLETALIEFSKQADLQVIGSTETLADARTRGVSGKLSSREALGVLLENTSIMFNPIGTHSVQIVSAPVRTSAETLTTLNLAQSDASDKSENAAAGKGGSSKAKTPQIEEIIVTAQKRKERAIDVPMSITAISGDELAAGGIKNMLDLSYRVPGLSVVEIGPGAQFMALRGISSALGTSPLVGLYLDEMPISGFQSGFFQSLDLRIMDMERVEVLKGPQGTLFGEGAAGGVVRYITKDPDLRAAGGEIGTEFYNTADGGWSQEVTGVVNVPVVADSFGIRMAAKYENMAGWIDQPSIGKEDINDSEVVHARVKALFAPNETFSLKATAEIHRNEGGGTNLVNTGRREDSNFLQAFNRSESTDYYDDYDLFNLAVTYDFGFAELLSSSSYVDSESNQRLAQLLDEAPRPWLELMSTSEASGEKEAYAQEFRLTSSSQGPLRWTLGANYKNGETVTFTRSGNRGIVNIPGLPAYLPISGATGRIPKNESENWAAFVDGSYDLTERLEVGAGLRYFADSRASSDASLPAQGVLRADFHKTTYRVYAKYALEQNVNLYASVGTGFRSGDFNAVSSIVLGAPRSYAPEVVTSYEVGTKMALLDGRVQLEGAVYYSEYQDMLGSQAIVSPVNNQPIQFTGNAQESEVKGVEASFSWLATSQLVLTLSGGVTDTEITEMDPTVTAPIYFIGDPINYTAKYRLATTAEYQFQFRTLPSFLRLSYNRQGKSYSTDRSFQLLRVEQRHDVAPEVDFLNASVGTEWKGWGASLFGRNLLDEAGELNACVTGCSAQARPRTIGVGISKSF